jgi:hypothetical protein
MFTASSVLNMMLYASETAYLFVINVYSFTKFLALYISDEVK